MIVVMGIAVMRRPVRRSRATALAAGGIAAVE